MMKRFDKTPIDIKEDAFERGRADCLAHDGDVDKVDNPYPAGSEESKWWNRGWNDDVKDY